ncbi:UbiA prenyltransferase family-domain-containing protein [Hypoxylon rubiginosum]|uniref:UbiA prenyltransferase family-domain-containing protein n=1 Tax=Hypoxylon rubiginosum TaxID=110542 RepID=A0ACB9YH72_9PEZI|nr:UbiA prenyltransferase family-domain-containing protein [Hypoxylon rubiginosum]
MFSPPVLQVFIKALGWSLRKTSLVLHILWSFIESDFVTFAIPNTAFGVFGAIASPVLVQGPSSPIPTTTAQILHRLPYILGFNVANLLVFDLANQRAPQSVAEDRINKPWRPIPRGQVSMDQVRRLMLVSIPFVLALNYTLGVWQQGTSILVLTWMYNDLRGGDEAFLREVLIAIAYGLFNSGSLSVAVGSGQHSLSARGVAWVATTSGVTLTTMQVQDLKDQEGDRVRGRKTIALFLGDQVSRVSISFFVCFWSCVCARCWTLDAIPFFFIAVFAAVVAIRVLFVRSAKGDARTWRYWCFWHASLYALPLLASRE